jgi:hypothetical protein
MRSSTAAAPLPPWCCNSSTGAHRARQCCGELEHLSPLPDEVRALLASAVLSSGTSLLTHVSSSTSLTRAASSRSSPVPWCPSCCSGVGAQLWSDTGRSPSLGGGLRWENGAFVGLMIFLWVSNSTV